MPSQADSSRFELTRFDSIRGSGESVVQYKLEYGILDNGIKLEYGIQMRAIGIFTK